MNKNESTIIIEMKIKNAFKRNIFNFTFSIIKTITIFYYINNIFTFIFYYIF